MANPSIYFRDKFALKMPSASIGNVNAPIFAGVSSVVNNSDGTFTASWLVASGSAQSPIRYQIYVALGSVSSAVLFQSSNILKDVYGLNTSVTMLPNGSYLTKGQQYTIGVRALSANGISDTNTQLIVSTLSGMNLSSIPAQVWDESKASHTTSGTFGYLLDDQVSKKLDSTSYTAPNNADVSAIKAKTDNLPVDPASNTQVNTRASQSSVNAIPTNPLLTNDSRLNNLDATISSRLPTSGYTAPDNTSINAIKAKTDQLAFVGGLVASIAQTVSDKTGYALTSGERDAIATVVESHLLNEGDGQMLINAIVGAIGNQNIDEVALVASIRADIERNGGMLDTKSSQSSVSAIPTNPLLSNDSRLNHLDTDISSRLPSSSYVSPDNAGISAIKLKTDNLPSDPASESTVNTVQSTIDDMKKNTDLIPATL